MDILGNYVEEKLLRNAEGEFTGFEGRFFESPRTGFAFDALEDGVEKESGMGGAHIRYTGVVRPR